MDQTIYEKALASIEYFSVCEAVIYIYIYIPYSQTEKDIDSNSLSDINNNW